MALRRRRPIKRGPSRLTHYADPEIERLRREVDEEIRRLRHLPDEEEGPVECCEEAFLVDGSRAMTAAFNAGGFDITNVGTVDGIDVSAHAGSSTEHGITSFAATLLDDTSAGAMRSTMGLGSAAVAATTDFEAAGAIATHAAVTSSVHGITSFAATVLDDTSASAMRTTLGLHAVAASGDHGALGGLGDDDHTQYLLRTDVPGTVTRFLARITPGTTITSTTSPTSIFGGSITVPANTLTSNGMSIRGHVHGNWLQGAIGTWDFLISLNGVTLMADTSTSFSSSSTRRAFRIDFTITRLDSTHATATFIMSYAPLLSPATGLGDLATANTQVQLGTSNGGVATMNWTAGQALNITIDPSSNSLEFVVEGGYIEAL